MLNLIDCKVVTLEINIKNNVSRDVVTTDQNIEHEHGHRSLGFPIAFTIGKRMYVEVKILVTTKVMGALF